MLMEAIARSYGLEDRLLTIEEVAEKLRVNQSTIFRLMKSGKLPYIKVSRRFTRIREKELEYFLNKHTFSEEEQR